MALFGSRLSKLAQFLSTGGAVPETAISTAETDTTLVLAPDGAGGVEFRADPGGGSSRWTQVINESGASFAAFAAQSGTWSSDGTLIHQTVIDGTFNRARYNTKLPQGTGVVIEAELRFPSAGQSTNLRRIGLLIGYDGAAGGAMGVFLDEGNNKIGIEYESIAALRDITGVTINQDTWYKLRVANVGPWLSIWLDGTFMGNVHYGAFDVDGDYLGLYNYNAKSDIRNVKAWVATGDLPA